MRTLSLSLFRYFFFHPIRFISKQLSPYFFFFSLFSHCLLKKLSFFFLLLFLNFSGSLFKQKNVCHELASCSLAHDDSQKPPAIHSATSRYSTPHVFHDPSFYTWTPFVIGWKGGHLVGHAQGKVK
ncbi:hypothetical protein DM01DRAFT_1012357 [Hesseltinella vesiculosa]|uniref:Uncharacterized protein n=1 Tax=Hesseltinella vesiculosa TaxID=101127 RepID=A0A1X2GYF8_9FUNG|nr:hypothetical protein DM01DRAFT_1012357 [Hesseltinella vesiculosa]